MSPLEAVYGPEVALATVSQATLLEELFRAVAVPDLDALLREQLRVRRTLDEPEQLLEDAAHERALRREQRQGRVRQRKAQVWRGEERERARARAVGTHVAGVEDGADEVEVLLLVVLDVLWIGHRGSGKRTRVTSAYARAKSRLSSTVTDRADEGCFLRFKLWQRFILINEMMYSIFSSSFFCV